MPVIQPSTLPLRPCVMNVTPPPRAKMEMKTNNATRMRPPLPSPLLQRRRGSGSSDVEKHPRGLKKSCSGSPEDVVAPEDLPVGHRRTPSALASVRQDMDRATVKVARP